MKNLQRPIAVWLAALVVAVAAGCATAPQETAPAAMPEPTQAAPEPEPEPTPAPEPAMEPMVEESDAGELTYTVVRGDTLWDIASYRVIYGDPYQWPLIFKANTNQIDDADLIEPEWVLTIPSASASEVDAAIQHARTRGAWSLGVIEESDLEFLRQ